MNIPLFSQNSLMRRIGAARELHGAQMGRCRTVVLPPGHFYLDRALVNAGARGLVLEGAGPDATELVVDAGVSTGIVKAIGITAE